MVNQDNRPALRFWHMHPNELRKLIKECILEILMENLDEGFDPLSQGPNIPEENPYPQWNAQMRALEETEDTETHGRYAQESGAGQFDARTFRQLDDLTECKHCGNKFDYAHTPESSMGLVECPQCKKHIDQEGNPFS